jgi:2-octaprenyl-6-methoxyphenol hydroxylase
MDELFDAIVVGAGPAGLTAAVALASSGCRTAIAGPPFNRDPQRPDTRTTALLRASVQFLRNTGVWDLCEGSAAPLQAIRLIDDTGHIITAPEVTFDCREIGGEPFGYNIANTALVTALRQRAEQFGNLSVIETAGVAGLEPDQRQVTLTLEEGLILRTRLVAGADGRNSVCRAAAGIGTTNWAYPQKALAFNFEHSEAHENCSNEFHRPSGPFTTVPLPGRASSLVWVESPGEAERLIGLGEPDLASEMETRLHGLLGSIRLAGPRAAFPLSGMTVNRFAARRIALVGEAAHVIPPIGAQGLNLGFRDAAALADCAGSMVQSGEDPGSGRSLRAYDMARRGDVATRTIAVDLLNRSLISGFVPLRLARGIGLHLLSSIAPLRQLFMNEGLAPQRQLPPLMQRPAAY